jgi:DNA-binding transcriptional LysR family regulator
MKLDQLEIFVAVVESGSFAKAANQILLISQPAVSASVRKLEESLGFLLFDRSHYRPELTPQGRAFYAKALNLLEKSAELTHYARFLADGVEPELKIAFDPYSLHPSLLQVLKAQMRCFERTRFEFLHERVGGAIARLADKHADLAVLPWSEAHYSSLNLEHSPIFSFDLSPMASADHPLALAKEITEKLLSQSVQIVLRSNERYLQGDFGIQSASRQWYVDDKQTKQLLIQMGLGFGALAHHVTQTERDKGELICLTHLPTYQLVKQEVHIVRRKTDTHGPVAQALWQALKNQAKAVASS